MKKKKEGQDKGRIKVRNTRKIYIPLYLMAIFLLASLIYIKFSGNPLHNLSLKLVLFFIAFIILFTEIHRFGNSYEVNENSVIHKKGYLTVISKRIEFGAISDCDIKQTIWQRLFSYGDIEIHRFSEITLIKNISNPSEFLNFLERRLSGRGRVR